MGNMSEDVVFDYGPEWRAYDEEDRLRKSRVGAPLTYRLHDMGVHTFIGSRYAKLTYIHSKLIKRGNRVLIRILKEINRLCSLRGIDDSICEDAARYARIMCNHRDTRGFCNRYGADKLAEAMMFIASMVNGVPCDLDNEVKRLGFRISYMLMRSGHSFPSLISKVVSRRISSGALNARHERLANQLYRLYRDRLVGMSSGTVAAALLYVSGKLLDIDVTQTQMAKKMNVTDTALRYILKNIGIRVRYVLRVFGKEKVVDEWWPGKDTYGIRMPREIASMHGILKYRSHIMLPSSPNDPITVLIYPNESFSCSCKND